MKQKIPVTGVRNSSSILIISKTVQTKAFSVSWFYPTGTACNIAKSLTEQLNLLHLAALGQTLNLTYIPLLILQLLMIDRPNGC
jgi:hypothetical protein